MSCTLTTALLLGSGGHSGGLQGIVGLARKADGLTMTFEAIMARARALPRYLSTDRRRSQDARNDQGQDASPNRDIWVGQVLENQHNTSQEEALKRIASLPHILQGKVLDIRGQLAHGTYEVADRLNKSIDRSLESLTA